MHVCYLCRRLQEGMMPNCSAYPNEFDYRHNINDDQYQIFAVGEAPLVCNTLENLHVAV